MSKSASRRGHGLAYAHERGVTHRDISTDNLVVSFDGVVKVVDFGIAQGAGALADAPSRTASTPTASRLTQVGGIIGKLAYMPPNTFGEQEAVFHPEKSISHSVWQAAASVCTTPSYSAHYHEGPTPGQLPG